MPAPLPAPNPYDTTTQPLIRSAYNRCLDLEYRSEKVPKHGRIDVLVCARMLGYMILEALTEKGRMNVAVEIIRYATKGDVGLQTLAEAYKNDIVHVFYASKERISNESLHSPDDIRGERRKKAWRPLSPADSRKRAMERDHYRCVISGRKDLISAEEGLTSWPVSLPCAAQAAHILGWSNKLAFPASTTSFLKNYGQIKVKGELNGKNIHRLENILTLSSDVQGWFDQLIIWLDRDPNDPPNTYRLASFRSNMLLDQMPQDIISFKTSDHTRLPLPDPRYLAFHAACARVADMSGVGDHIRVAIEEIENGRGLVKDGNLDTLCHTLMRRLICLQRK